MMATGQTLAPEIIAALLGDGDPDSNAFVLGLIDQFLAEATERVKALNDALARDDRAALKSAAHRLKGSAVTMGAERMSALCVTLESELDGSRPLTAAASLVHAITDELPRVHQACAAQRDALRA
jgi:HPt (histidine-containing phosphotransfer) domain-containing protein